MRVGGMSRTYVHGITKDLRLFLWFAGFLSERNPFTHSPLGSILKAAKNAERLQSLAFYKNLRHKSEKSNDAIPP